MAPALFYGAPYYPAAVTAADFDGDGIKDVAVSLQSNSAVGILTGVAQADVYTCGDANGDQTINVGDPVFLIAYIFKSGPAPDPLDAGDANCDGGVNVGDAVYLIAYVFKQGQEPCCP